MEQNENTLSVLKIAPGQHPQQVEIDNDLKALQQAVGGSIGASYPFEDPAAIVYNDDGKLMGLPLNRALRDENGEMFRASYSILQDELFNYMTEQGFKGFQRGEYGSTAEHLTSLQYQIKQDKERLEKLQQRIQKEQVKYEPARHISKTLNEIDGMGQKTFTGKMAISKEDYSQLTALAKEGITSRAEIKSLEQNANYYRQKYFDSANALERMKTKYNELKEKCKPFLEALEHFPEVAKLFTEKVRQLFSFKEEQQRAEKEAREKERQERIKARRNKRDMER